MLTLGRYAILDALARGGMATVHLGRLMGPAGFSRTVAIKRLHPHLARDPEFVTMLLDEARLAARIQHPNVVAVLDIVAGEGELFIVMEYVQGEALVRLVRDARELVRPVPVPVVSAIVGSTLRGLHAAHEIKGDRGEPLNLIHRDFTPHNIMVRRDGTSLVVDFGVAKAAGRFNTTEEGKIKGKLPYMAPEQLRGGTVSRQLDLWAAGAVLWETLVGGRLFGGTTEAEVLERLLFAKIDPPSSRRDDVSPELDAVVLRALERNVTKRFATAEEMADALEKAVRPALTSEVRAWLEVLAGDRLREQETRIAKIESEIATPTSQVSPSEFLESLAESGSHGIKAVTMGAALAPQSTLRATHPDSPPARAAAVAPAPTPPPAPTEPAPPVTAAVAIATPAAPAPREILDDTAKFHATSSDAKPAGKRGERRLLVLAGIIGVCAASGLIGWRLASPGAPVVSPSAAASPAAAAAISAPPLAKEPEPTAVPGAPAAPSRSAPSAPSASVAAAPSGPPVATPGPQPVARPAQPPAASPPKNAADCRKTDVKGRVVYDRRCLQ